MRRVGVGDDSTGGGQDALRLGDHRDSLPITSTPGHRKQRVTVSDKAERGQSGQQLSSHSRSEILKCDELISFQDIKIRQPVLVVDRNG